MNSKLIKAGLALPATLAIVGGGVAIAGAPQPHEAHAQSFDPAHTDLVASGWVKGIGCPTDASTSSTGTKPADGTYSDPACVTGDPKDSKNEGLLLAKTGPTANVAAAGADIKDVKGITLTELGYDIRKPGSPSDDRGSHCGNGAPRFNIYYSDGSVAFVGCNSPAPAVQATGNGWLRLRWTGGALPTAPVGATVAAIQLVMDEGQDTGPDNFGLSVLDNVDVNSVLIGQGDHGDLG